jgi:hypothetical protein
MAILFNAKDVLHRITAKFFPAYLPEAKKPYNLRAVHQPKLDIHGIASKAEAYGLPASPLLIEEGLTLGLELIYYLASDGYEIDTPVFQLRVGFPGEYDGHETELPEGTFPHGLITLAPQLREYLHRNVQPQFEGVAQNEGYVAEVINLYTGEVGTLRASSLFEVRGLGLKIAADAEHAADTGLFLESATDGMRLRINQRDIATNEPRTFKGVVSYGTTSLPVGSQWYIVVRTQTPVTGGNKLLKDVREVKSEFTATVVS